MCFSQIFAKTAEYFPETMIAYDFKLIWSVNN